MSFAGITSRHFFFFFSFSFRHFSLFHAISPCLKVADGIIAVAGEAVQAEVAAMRECCFFASFFLLYVAFICRQHEILYLLFSLLY